MARETPVSLREIRTALARRDMTQGQLAEMIGMNEQALSLRIRGGRPWRLTEILAVARALEVPLSQIVPEAAELERVS